ncbi:tetratricopeptide repeat protein [Listeria grayi]|uniref:Tetratricopeptide repeat protein n=1 Tax=Listeria grayi DSM 20601 TaxID=525367 RepID=D7UWA2_LISGR|nr:hypothetical protein [Listeria grayi]EFI84830.1 tetratricopeptide repeat protein [Listeria grayi DSM 20601]
MKQESKQNIIRFLPSGHYYFERGIHAFREGEMKEAVRYLLRANDLSPNDPIILCQLAICYTELGQFLKSNRLLLQVIDTLDTSLHYCYYFIANNFAYLNDISHAIQYAKRYLELDPDGEYAEEVEDLLEVLAEENPIRHLRENQFANIEQQFQDYIKEWRRYEASENMEAAAQFLEGVLLREPNFWPAYNQLALLDFRQLKEAEGLKVLLELIDRDPGNLMGLADLCMYYFYKADMESCREIYGRLDHVAPTLVHHKEKLAIVHTMLGNIEKARALFVQLAETEVVDKTAYYYYFAKVEAFSGEMESAEDLWQLFTIISGYEPTNFPWKNDRQNDVLEIIALLRSTQPAEKLYGAYQLAHSANRAELLLFDPLFDQSSWDYDAYLILTDFKTMGDSIEEKNTYYLCRLLEHKTDQLTSADSGFYKDVFAELLSANAKEEELSLPGLEGLKSSK